MQPNNQNKLFIQTAPRKRLNSTEQTLTLMKLKISQNRLYMLMNVLQIFQNLSSHKTEVIILTKLNHIWQN